MEPLISPVISLADCGRELSSFAYLFVAEEEAPLELFPLAATAVDPAELVAPGTVDCPG